MSLVYLTLTALLLGSVAVAQALPVKVYETGRAFRGTDAQPVVVVPSTGTQYFYVNGYKVGGRPWADAVFKEVSAAGTKYLSRTYHCANGTWRNLGEGPSLSTMSLAIGDLRAVADQKVPARGVTHALAKFACGL